MSPAETCTQYSSAAAAWSRRVNAICNTLQDVSLCPQVIGRILSVLWDQEMEHKIPVTVRRNSSTSVTLKSLANRMRRHSLKMRVGGKKKTWTDDSRKCKPGLV